MESLTVENEEGWTNQNLYLFYEKKRSRKRTLFVCAVNSSSLSVAHVAKFLLRNSWNMGYVAHGLKLYAIGGLFSGDCGNRGYPRQVFTCDLSKSEEAGSEHEWKEGPCLNGGKPSPMVVEVKRRIYALAGYFGTRVADTIDPAFEALDPRGKFWSPLPKPPFQSWYSQSPGPELVCHTVVGNVIYVLVRKPGKEGVEVLFSYNVVRKKWKAHPYGFVYGDSVGDNLINYVWDRRADVVDDKLYFCTVGNGYLNLQAHDLTFEKKLVQKIISGAASTTSPHKVHDSSYIYWDVLPECGIPFIDLPVKLLKSIDETSETLVAHVGNQMLLVVCAYYPSSHYPGIERLDGGRLMYTCLLRLVIGSQNMRDHVVVVKHKYSKISRTLASFSGFATM